MSKNKVFKKVIDWVTLAEEKRKENSPYYKDYAQCFIPEKKLTERDLIYLESRVGSRIFGEIPVGHIREFFCYDKDTWMFYESWQEDGVKKETTVKYEVQKKGILKVMPGLKYEYLRGAELENFMAAVRNYTKVVGEQVYHPAAA